MGALLDGDEALPTYYAVRFYHLAEEVAQGDRPDKDNALRWDDVCLNWSGHSHWNPFFPGS
jgi:hypothetical protein